MIVVDSSVWIDYLRGRSTRQTDWLDAQMDIRQFVLGDLMLVEVLQGCRTDREFRETRSELARFDLVDIAGAHVAEQAAHHYRLLRSRGRTPRKTIDTLIATRCILDGLPLLYSDRDFDPFVENLGLVSAIDTASGVN